MGDQMELRPDPSTWIDKNFIEGALRKREENNEISVESVTVINANKEGSGYASLMYRVSAHIRTKICVIDKSLIVKTPMNLGKAKEITDDINAFDLESLVLYEIMPQIHSILQSLEGESFSPLVAKCFDHGKLPTDYIVMEDLMASGFRLADAGKPLDLAHCTLVMHSYARLHAASAFLIKEKPKCWELLAKDSFTEGAVKDFYSNFVSTACLAAANELKKNPEYEKYAVKYVNISDSVMERISEVVKRQQEITTLTVMAHGDCWRNNMMFKYSDQHVLDMRLLDFQIACTNSPVRDLTNFLYTSASMEVHRDHLDALLAEYHSTLVATLRALGMHDAADDYPLEQLNKDMDDYLPVAILFMLLSSISITADEVGADLAKSFNDPDMLASVLERSYDNPYTSSYLKYQTSVFERKGIL